MAKLPRIEIEAQSHPRYRWILVPLRIDGRFEIEMVVNPGVSRSSIATAIRDRLFMEELVPPRRERAYVLESVSVQGQLLPPLSVRVSGALGRIGAGGILGLDFFAQYEDIHLHLPSFRLTLNGS